MEHENSRKRGLGRGLSALLAGSDPEGEAGSPPAERRLPIEALRPNPDQPRRDFGEDELADLTASIRERGIIQPIIVRPDPGMPGQMQIVAGERRWRAAQRAGLHEVPVIVRALGDLEVLEISIIENIQRANLNPVEEASGYRQLMDRFGHTQERLAEAMGKSRSHIANLMRLLALPPEILAWLREGRLTAGHARALLTAPDPVALATETIRKGLSVREVERLAKRPPAAPRTPVASDPDTRALEADLSAQLGLKVAIAHHGTSGEGELRIRYRTLDDLDGLCQILSRVG